jgi:hypothetical protein
VRKLIAAVAACAATLAVASPAIASQVTDTSTDPELVFADEAEVNQQSNTGEQSEFFV